MASLLLASISQQRSSSLYCTVLLLVLLHQTGRLSVPQLLQQTRVRCSILPETQTAILTLHPAGHQTDLKPFGANHAARGAWRGCPGHGFQPRRQQHRILFIRQDDTALADV